MTETALLASRTSLTKAKLAVDMLCRDPEMPPERRARLIAVARQGLACHEGLAECDTFCCQECNVYLRRGGVACGS